MSDLISRQAAIDVIDEIEAEVADGYGYQYAKWREYFCDLPPAQLGANLAEVGTDCISRQAAIDAIAKMMPQSFTPDGSHPADNEIFIAQEAFADCIKTIEILPPAQPERIKGHWINGHCDKCNEHAPFWCMASTYHESNFCPNCGADMREVTE